jgi:hypothetical protein
MTHHRLVTPEEAIVVAMPKWANRTWLAKRALDALRAAGFRVAR